MANTVDDAELRRIAEESARQYWSAGPPPRPERDPSETNEGKTLNRIIGFSIDAITLLEQSANEDSKEISSEEISSEDRMLGILSAVEEFTMDIDVNHAFVKNMPMNMYRSGIEETHSKIMKIAEMAADSNKDDSLQFVVDHIDGMKEKARQAFTAINHDFLRLNEIKEEVQNLLLLMKNELKFKKILEESDEEPEEAHEELRGAIKEVLRKVKETLDEGIRKCKEQAKEELREAFEEANRELTEDFEEASLKLIKTPEKADGKIREAFKETFIKVKNAVEHC
ncbi:uncharacterized protein PF3D7_1120000-like [Centruroides vittatus]|uniref:uncharacterized protein PF3D7_1120000-like n=1 Tax=Centruroides vittatus TaxID=120091 RepID=UPI0035104020